MEVSNPEGYCTHNHPFIVGFSMRFLIINHYFPSYAGPPDIISASIRRMKVFCDGRAC